MKIRRKTKCTQQEDHKADLTLWKTPSSVDPITLNFGIRQEDTKNRGNLLLQAGKISSVIKREELLNTSSTGEFGAKDYYYRCDICKKRLTSLKLVLEHRRSIHKTIRQMGCTIIKDIQMEPDTHDPNFY